MGTVNQLFMEIDKDKKDEFLDISNYFIEISQKIYNGWHLVVKGDKISTVEMGAKYKEFLKFQGKEVKKKIKEISFDD